MRGGEERAITVNYENLPLVCFICGRLGHGDKDCFEHRGDTSPIKRYGTWLKASPWRGGDSRGDDKKGGLESQCARRLFFTKPMSAPSELSEKEVEDVLVKMGNVGLNSAEMGRKDNESNGKEVNLDKENHDREDQETSLSLKGNSKGGEEEENNVTQTAANGVQTSKKWRRARKKSGNEKVQNNACGRKRLLTNIDDDSSTTEMEIDNQAKQKQLIEEDVTDGLRSPENTLSENVVTNAEVAGPTKWDLCDQ